MVLPEVDDASPDPNSDTFSNDPASPTYNPDAYSSVTNTIDADGPTITLASGQTLPLWTVDSIRALYSENARYPNPFTGLPLISRLLISKSEKSRYESIVAHINRTQIYVARPLNPIEVQAEAYYHNFLKNTVDTSEAIGIVSFLALATFRQSAAKTRPGLIAPYARRFLGPFLGDLYIGISRFTIYGFVGTVQGSLIGAIVGGNKVNGMMKNDPNIPELRRDLAEFRNWTEEELRRKLKQRRQGGPKESLFPTTEEIVMRKKHPEDNEDRGGQEISGEGGFEEIADDQSQSTLPKPVLNTYRRQENKQQPSFDDSSRSQGDALTNLYDESSSSSLYSLTSSAPGQANSGESSWDRIRRERLQTERRSGQSHSGVRVPSSEEVPRVPKTDSFTFSDSDRERQLAQAEAQRDFDARVERERKGETGWGRR